MSYRAETLYFQSTFQSYFAAEGISIDVKKDHVEVPNTLNFNTSEKIQKFLQAVTLFCPIIAQNSTRQKWCITVVPFALPRFFSENSSYLGFEEIKNRLSGDEIVYIDEGVIIDRWEGINFHRAGVFSALQKGLSEIIESYAPGDCPIVEIGSGSGYTFSNDILSRLIRSQIDNDEAILLTRATTDPVYKTDIEGIYECLKTSGKKIPLFFGLNVFDSMCQEERECSIAQLSKLQNSGDHILILLDANPNLTIIIPELELCYPKHVFLPFLPLELVPAKTSVIAIPYAYAPVQSPEEFKENELTKLFLKEVAALNKSRPTHFQRKLHELHAEHDFDIIPLEDFYLDKIQGTLQKGGYSVESYYHNAFVTESRLSGFYGNLELGYRGVADVITTRGWSRDDIFTTFATSLKEKQLCLPSEITPDYMRVVTHRGEMVLGTEILVVAAKKL